MRPSVLHRQIQPEAKFRVILKQAVAPRHALPFLIDGIGAAGRAPGVDGRAARGIGNHQVRTEQLCQQLDIRRFAAPRARAGELKQRRFCLRERDGVRLPNRRFRQRHGEIPVCPLLRHFRCGAHHQRLVLRRARSRAVFASRAVQWRHLHAEIPPGKRLSLRPNRMKIHRKRRFRQRVERADAPMRADKAAQPALDARFRPPLWNLPRNAALFEPTRAQRRKPARVHGGHRQHVSLLAQHRAHEGFDC